MKLFDCFTEVSEATYIHFGVTLEQVQVSVPNCTVVWHPHRECRWAWDSTQVLRSITILNARYPGLGYDGTRSHTGGYRLLN